jgi:single-stranded-DNA-specific exonuclease
MKIVQKSPYNGNLINTVLCNRNIGDIDLFLTPDNSSDSHPAAVSNIEQGLELLLTHLADPDSKISIVVDQDADGYTSGAVLHNYLTRLNQYSAIGYILHETKAHGFTPYIMGRIYEEKPTLVVIPDAGSNDVEQIEELVSKGIDVLVIDHHHVSSFTDKGVIINNQLCEHTNKRLVGVGMVYKFCQYIDMKFNLDRADDYLDLVAVGQIGDSSDIAENEIRYLVHRGLDNIRNGFLVAALGERPMDSVLAARDLSFGVIPTINAVTRVGTIEDRDNLFRALANIDTDKVYPTVRKKKNKDTGKFENITFDYTIYEHALNTSEKAKTRQNAIVKKMMEQLEASIVDDAGIIIAFTDDSNNQGVTGLVANKIMSKYDKPALLLNEQENTYTGSGRGHTKTLIDFRAWCEKSNLIEFAQGHDNAFGFCIRKDKLDEFKEYSRSIEKQEIVYEVDLVTSKPDKGHCEDVDKNNRLFGGSVSEPFIGLVGLSVPKRFISFKGSMLTVYSWGVSCVQFNSSYDLYEAMLGDPENFDPNESIKLNMVGYYGMNEYNGVRRPQFFIKDIEIVEEKIDQEVTVDNIIF